MRRASLFALTAVAASALAPGWGSGGASAADPSATGLFSAPFKEPGDACAPDAKGVLVCQPAAATTVALPDGTLLYWDGLEGTERSTLGAGDFGEVAGSDKSRILDLRGRSPKFFTPINADGGANPDGLEGEYLPGVPHANENKDNDGNLFCADQVHLADGTVLATGGTAYYNEPGIPGQTAGSVELEGLKNSRIFNPATRSWSQTAGMMGWGRWYPSLVTLADGKVFVASGVTKLIKPFYPERPTEGGTNVKQTETFDSRTGTWTDNGRSADRSLPLYPRLHLLPNGHVFYNAAGQTFNPAGQSYDEALWNLTASYDPAEKVWTDLGVPGVGTLTPGFRGSSFSVMLPLEPDAKGAYSAARFLSAGGVAGVSPGGYLGLNTSQINTVDTAAGNRVTTKATGPLKSARWYASGVVTPTGDVVTFSGADRDEVVAPGSGTPNRTVEIFDPKTGTWSLAATAKQGRTYHNSGLLLPDGRILVTGHAPIPTGYGPGNESGTAVGLSNPRHDQTFEIFSPPYLFRGQRPVIRSVDSSLAYGKRVTLSVTDAAAIDSVVLSRNTAVTHLVDGDQRTVKLPIVSRTSSTVTVLAPPSGAVAPPGPYLLFANKTTDKGLTPSVSRQVYVGAPVPAALRKTIESNTKTAVASELAARSGSAAKPGAAGAGAGSAPAARPAARPAAPAPAPAPAIATAPVAAGGSLATTGPTDYVLPGLVAMALAAVGHTAARRFRPRSARRAG